MNVEQSRVTQTVHLSPERAERLRALAHANQLTEDQVVGKALEILFSLAGVLSPAEEQRAVTAASEESLARAWENDRDAAYDNWRELYGVPAR